MKKIEFLKDEFVPILSSMDHTQPALFGKMNFHQMVEHMSDSIQIANGKSRVTNEQDPELTAKMKNFMLSEKPFRDNTPNPMLPDIPPPTRHELLSVSLNELQQEIDDFIHFYKDDEMKTITNPFFGDLNFDEWTHLLHKHALHHLRQFGFE